MNDQKPPTQLRPFARPNKIQAPPGSDPQPLAPKRRAESRTSYAQKAIKALEERIAASKSEAQKTQLTQAIVRWKLVIEKESEK